jgi:hypothetical protein
MQEQSQTLTVITTGAPEEAAGVKLSWFGGLTMGRTADPEPSSNGVALVASPLDLLATKLKVMLQRTGLPLTQGLAAARALYGPSFPISETLKALVYFHDGDLAALPQSVREQLEQEVRGVDELPTHEGIQSSSGPAFRASAPRPGGEESVVSSRGRPVARLGPANPWRARR